jgi:hypothetical protein
VRINKVTIRNFRCLEEVEILFEDVTTFLGPNGVGKSTVLHALDWFFNGVPGGLSDDDVFLNDPSRSISVAVEFDEISLADRERLGKYARPPQQRVVIARHWADGSEKMVGRGMVFPLFEDVRSGATAADRRASYTALRSEHPDLDLPAWSNNAAVLELMAAWEEENPARLEEADVESSTHFFGFAGQSAMSGLFDFILVSADLRAEEEATDTRSAVIGRVLELAVDRSGADAEIASLLAGTSEAQAAVHRRYFDEPLAELSKLLTSTVSSLSAGREVRITSETPPPQAQQVRFEVAVLDQTVHTKVGRQGHGFQRALLIAALQVLAARGRAPEEPGVICLAIEEPELYQHPLQARTFAAVLRSLAEDPDQGVQVAYATHSPYFIEARSFEQIRRVTRAPATGGQGATTVVGSTVEQVVSRLDGYLDEQRIRRQLDSVCLGGLGEGFFADVVLLVEGTTEQAVLKGAAARDSVPLLLEGIFVGEAGGKTGLLLPYVILDELGIPAYVVADNDSHLLDKLRWAKDDSDLERTRNLKASIEDSKSWNHKLLRFFGEAEQDWPAGQMTSHLMFVDGGLEIALEEMWPSWAETREELIESGAGFSGKDRSTYEEAALQAADEPPEMLTALLDSVRALRLVA